MMKKYMTPNFLVSCGVVWIMFCGGLSMLFRGSVNPSPELLRVREMLFSLATYAMGGVLSSRRQGKGDDKVEDKKIEQ